MRLPGWQKIKGNLERLRTPELDWIQVEVSSYCDCSCFYCPHTVHRDIWQDRHLPLTTFRKLLPALSEVDLLYLQGWGEPFQNPDFFEMVRLAKAAGCMVGTSTNGMLLDESKIKQIVASGMDIIAFSLAGVDENDDTIRRGTSFRTVMKAIDSINREKAKTGTSTPAINIAYMLLRSGMDDLPGLPSAFSGSGINQIVVSTLDFVPDKELAEEALLPKSDTEFDVLQARLHETVEEGKSNDLDIHYNLYNPSKRRRVCTENVLNSLFVSSDGTVSPCVFTNMPISKSTLSGDDAVSSYQCLIFGDIETHALFRIWNQKDYKIFRKSFNTDQPPDICLKCLKLYMNQGKNS